jgi:spore germination cell wall hydrolase CwlJ-like protein
MKHVANTTADIFDKPGGTKIDTLTPNEEVVATGRTDGLHMEITLDDGTVAWGLEADFDPKDPNERQAVERLFFVEDCIKVERDFNAQTSIAPWFVSADFLIARALMETDIVNAGPKIAGSDAVGPLLVSSAEWKAFLKDAPAELKANYGPTDFDHWLKQILGAAWRMHADAKAFSKLKEQKGVNTADRDFLPTYLDLFHAYLLNSPEAAFAIDEAQNSDEGMKKKMDEVLKNGLKAEQLNALFARREKYLGTSAAPNTVGQFVEATGADLKAALERALDVIKEHAPNEIPTEPAAPSVIVVPVDPGNVARLPSGNPVEFAGLGPSATKIFWPVITADPQALVVSYQDTAGKIIGGNGRKFFADRRGGRHHVGLDLYCKDREVVLACADGKIVNFYRFYKSAAGENTFALFVEHDGVVVNYGEVKANAPAEFGWKIGDRVQAGDRIARVSSTNMIHFETYVPGTKQNSRWFAGGAKPPSLRNPTVLLLQLASSGTRVDTNFKLSIAGGSGQIGTSRGGSPVSVDNGDLLTLARTIYGEARSSKEPSSGREAVAHVVMNRVKRKHMGDDTVSKVCLRSKQFSCWNVGDPNRPVILAANRGVTPMFNECLEIAERVIKAQLADNTGGATHYYSHTIAPPNWTRAPAQQTTKIGSHLFFKNVR